MGGPEPIFVTAICCADVTVVEYFDYNCPFCKALAPAFHAFIDKDHAAAVLYKEWPIFGGVSIYAAQSALAANFQGKYLQAHDALISALLATQPPAGRCTRNHCAMSHK